MDYWGGKKDDRYYEDAVADEGDDDEDKPWTSSVPLTDILELRLGCCQ